MEIFFGLLVAGLCVWLLLRDQVRSRDLAELHRRMHELEAAINKLTYGRSPPEPTVTVLQRVLHRQPVEPPLPQTEAVPPKPTTYPTPRSVAPPEPSVVETTKATATSPPSAHENDPSPPTSSPPPFPSTPVRPTFNWEQFVGAKLFAWLGGLALFFAVAFGLKYSFEHNLIPPVVRALGGYAFGLALVGAGWILKRREYSVTAQTLVATGIVILYAVAFSCRSLLNLPAFTPTVTFGVMALVTIAAFTLSVRLEAQVVAVLGMLGGFLTPILVSTGEDRPGALFSYIALLDAGLLAVAWRRRWDYLSFLAALGTTAMLIGWMSHFFTPAKLVTAQMILIGFPVLFVATFAWAVHRGWSNDFLTAAAAGLAFVTLLVCFGLLSFRDVAATPGRLFTIVFAADLCLLAMVARSPKLRLLEAAGGALVFLLLAIWIAWQLSAPLVPWALGLTVLFAALHTAFPVLLRRWYADHLEPPPLWAQCFPALGLVLALIPLVRAMPSGPAFWAVILLVDALAIWVALTTGAALGLALVILLTFGLAAVRMVIGFDASNSFEETLIVVGGFALVLTVAAAWFGWRRPTDERMDPARQERWTKALPALSAVLPFLLLVMVLGQFKPTDPSSVYAVAAGLSVLLLTLVRIGGLGTLSVMGVVAAGLVQAAWQAERLGSVVPIVPVLWALGFCALFAAFPFLFRNRFADHRSPWVAAALVFVVQGGLVLWQVKHSFPAFPPGWIPALFAIPALVGLCYLARRLPEDSPARLTILSWWGGVALFGLSLIFPIQFERQWITVGWALEGAALCWLFHRIPHPGLRGLGVGLLVAAFVRLALNPSILAYPGRADGTIFNWMLYTYGVVVLCLFGAAWLLRPPRDQLMGTSVPPLLNGLGTLLAFLLVNLEIANYFNAGGRLHFEFSGNFARDMTYTIAWALFALVLVAVGVARRNRGARYSGLFLLGVALTKLFLHDLSRLNQIYRIAAFAAVAVIALLASFLYQRLAARRPEDPESNGS